MKKANDDTIMDDEVAIAVVQWLIDDMFESDNEDSKWGGSRPGKAPNKKRDFEGAYNRLVRQYFSGAQSTYDETDFERRFRVPRQVFTRIHDDLLDEEPFVLHTDRVTKKLGIRPLVRLTACFRRLAYGNASDQIDENLEVSETVVDQATKDFTKMVIEKYPQYLNRCPTQQEMQRISDINAARGFPGMFASWDCKHFKWDKCPVELQGQFRGQKKDE